MLAYYVASSDWADIIDALSRLVQSLVSVFGRTGAVIFIVLIFVVSVVLRRHGERKKERIYELVSEEKERAIDRLSKENLSLRVVLFKQVYGWSDDEIERFLLQNRFEDQINAARALTGESVARNAIDIRNDAGGQRPDPEQTSKERPPNDD